MKRFASVLLAVVLMLSLSVFSFASPQLIPVDKDDPAYGTDSVSSSGITPYALVPSTQNPYILTSRSSFNSGTWTQLSSDADGLFVGSGGVLTYIGSTESGYTNAFYIRSSDYTPVSAPNYWWNFIGKITDANGYVLEESDINGFAIFVAQTGGMSSNLGMQSPASDNIYSFDDGYLQIALSSDVFGYSNSYSALAVNVSNSSVVGPLSFEIEKFDVYSGEGSTTAYPFTFGAGAHATEPEVPVVKDPNVASDYGSAADQVEWYNDAYGSAVDPELADKTSEATDMILQQSEIESEVIDGLNQYSSQVDPANLSFPTQILNGLSFIGTTFMSSYNALGDIGFVMSLSMMLGVVMVIIGRGEGALARGMSASARERRRTEYASQRDMNKGG